MSSHSQPPILRKKDAFLSAYRIPTGTYKQAGFAWGELNEIFADYVRWQPLLEAEGQAALHILRINPSIRAVYSRTKDPEHLIEKLIRKSAKEHHPCATRHNYLTTITDLLGLRALHIFKEDWPEIDAFIRTHLDVSGHPEAKVTEADPADVIEMYERASCKIVRTEGYRSVHYAIVIRCKKQNLLAELQVRTLFEEAWGEVNHRIDYPRRAETLLLHQFMSLSSDFAGLSDQIASASRLLHDIDHLVSCRGPAASKRRNKLWNLFSRKVDFLLNKNTSTARLAIHPSQIPPDLVPKILRG